MELAYKLIVSDFDGTLRRTQGGISDENLNTIKRYVERGGIFALCTGRMPISILPYAKELGLKGLVVSYQGANIQDIESGLLVRDERIDWKDAAGICEFMYEHDWHIHVYDADVLYVNKDDQYRAWYEKACDVRSILTEKNISKEVVARQISPHKIIVICSAEERGEIIDLLTKKFGNEFYVTSSTENLIEILKRGCDKGKALEYLAQYYGIPREQTMAIGDNYNDAPMLRIAGKGVAVENGELALKQMADFITKTCDEDGVAYAIKKFGLGENI